MSILPQRGGKGRKDVISFGAGSPGPDGLPGEEFREIVTTVLAEDQTPALNYGPTEGDEELRTCLLAELRSRNVVVPPDQLVITAGAMQGLDLVCKLFVNPGDLVAVESPAFTNALATVASYHGSFLPVSVDEDGMVIDELAEKCRLRGSTPRVIYVNPTFQNPTGVSLSLERRGSCYLWRRAAGRSCWRTTPTDGSATRGRACRACTRSQGVPSGSSVCTRSPSSSVLGFVWAGASALRRSFAEWLTPSRAWTRAPTCLVSA